MSEARPLRRFVDFYSGAAFPQDDQGRHDGELPFIKVSDLGCPDREVTCAESTVDVDTARRLGAHPAPSGTILFPKVGAALLTNRRRLLGIRAVFDNNVMGFRPHEAHDSRWFYYWSTTLDMKELANPGALPSVTVSQVGSARLVVPDGTSQKTIADYLDSETSRIDSLVDRKQRFIELLLEKRTALITHAVTKGLDPDVEMKDSGVPWVGEIPQHWSLMRVRHLCDVTTGGSDTVDANPDAEYPFFVRSQVVERINTYSYDGEAVLTAGDGAGVAKVFHHHVGKFDYHQRVYAFTRFRHVTGRFFFHFLRENFYKVALDGAAKSTVDSLRRPMILDFWMTVPPSDEQDAIVALVESETATIDALVEKTRCSIELLTEYRTALISAAVTGQIEIHAADSGEDVA